MIDKNELKNLLKIDEVIERYIQIVDKSSPTDMRAVCPFHGDKNPSLSINPEKQFFNCFGCDAGGDVFKFIELIENVSFTEAFSIGLKIAGIETSIEGLSLLKEVSDYYNSRAPQIASYFDGRHIVPEMIEFFKLGFADNNIQEFLSTFNSSKEHLVELNLLIKKDEGTLNEYLAPKFKNRLMIPIRSHLGIISVSGRTLGSSSTKYLNTEDTRFFKKSKTLYNYDFAAEYIKKFNHAILVEGFFDAQRAMVHELYNTVATLGTAFTTDQASILKRLTNRLCFIYDGDSAGLKSMGRGAINALSVGLSDLHFGVLPDGEDPDSYLLKNGSFENLEIVEFLKFVKIYPELFVKDKVQNALNSSQYLDLIDPEILSYFGIKPEFVKKEQGFNFKNRITKKTNLTELALLVSAYPTLRESLSEDGNSLVDEELNRKDVLNLIVQNKNYFERISESEALKIFNKLLEE